MLHVLYSIQHFMLHMGKWQLHVGPYVAQIKSNVHDVYNVWIASG